MRPYEALEREFGKWVGSPNTVACSSGTAALHLALETLALPTGSKVIVPEFTMIACPRAVSLANLEPVLIDCNERLLLDCDLLSEVYDKKVKAIMPVHIYGRRCDMERVAAFASNKGLAVIEDLAEAHGIDPHPQTDAACWSFYRNKIVAGEEGGMIAFKRPEHAAIARQLRSLGFTAAHDFIHIPRGTNYRLASTLAELIRWDLAKVTEHLHHRRRLENYYSRLIPKPWQMPPRDVCWVYDLRLEKTDTRDVVRCLNGAGVAARLGFQPVSAQPEYHHLGSADRSPRAYQAAREVIYLPITLSMGVRDVSRVVKELLSLPPRQ